MRRGTTPTYVMHFSEGMGAKIENICLTFYQGQTKRHMYLSTGKITLIGDIAQVTLLQEETQIFGVGTIQRQVKVKLKDKYGGAVQTSDIVSEYVYDQLNEEVL